MESPLGSFLCPPGFAGPTGLRAIVRESSAVSEAARFVRRSAQDRLHRRATPYALRAPEHALIEEAVQAAYGADALEPIPA